VIEHDGDIVGFDQSQQQQARNEFTACADEQIDEGWASDVHRSFESPGKDVAQPSASTKKSAVRASPGYCADQPLVGLLANADQCRGPCASKLLSFPHAIELSDSSTAQHLDAAMVLGHSVL
jgi:hypothetical protein